MFQWITGFFNLEPIKNPTPLDSSILSLFEYTVEQIGQRAHNCANSSDFMNQMAGHIPTGHGGQTGISTIQGVYIPSKIRLNVITASERLSVKAAGRSYAHAQSQQI